MKNHILSTCQKKKIRLQVTNFIASQDRVGTVYAYFVKFIKCKHPYV